jgi:Flp pilus assembly protein TadD
MFSWRTVPSSKTRRVSNALGVALSDAGRSDEAIEQFELALRVNPDDHAAAANLEEVSAKKREAADDPPPGL